MSSQYKEYGPHRYEKPDATGKQTCVCGCWKDRKGQGGPTGIDPSFGAACPHNPVDGKMLGKGNDARAVIEWRVFQAGAEARILEEALDEAWKELVEKARPKIRALRRQVRKLGNELAKAKSELAKVKGEEDPNKFMRDFEEFQKSERDKGF